MLSESYQFKSKIENEFEGEQKFKKAFTVTISVFSVTVKVSKFAMICQSMCFYSGVDIVYFEFNTI